MGNITRRIRRGTERRKKGVGNGRFITVYRGTRFEDELTLFRETDGYVMSDAARDGYYGNVNDGYDFRSAWTTGLQQSNVSLAGAIATWGGPGPYSEAHAVLGTELSKEFGKRPAISWTTDLRTAQRFAGPDGYVLKARIPIASILNPGWGKNAESEVLLANGVWATVYPSPTTR